MKVDKLFAVMVLGGGVMVGCGGQPATMPEADEAPASAPADEAAEDEAPAEEAPASAPAAGADGEDGKCAWF